MGKDGRWYSRQGLHLHCRRSRRRASGCWATRAKKACSRPDLHRHWTGFKPVASGDWATGAAEKRSGPSGRICTRTDALLRRVPLLLGYGGKRKNLRHAGAAPASPRWKRGVLAVGRMTRTLGPPMIAVPGETGPGHVFRSQRSSPWPHCPERQRKRVGRLTGYAPVPRRSQCRVLLLHYSLRVDHKMELRPGIAPGRRRFCRPRRSLARSRSIEWCARKDFHLHAAG